MDDHQIEQKLKRLLGAKLTNGLIERCHKYGPLEKDFKRLLLELTEYSRLMSTKKNLEQLSREYDISYFKLNKLLAVIRAALAGKRSESDNLD